MDGDPFAGLDAKYGIGTASAPPGAPTASAAATPPLTAGASGGDPYAALDAKYFGDKQKRTPAEQESDKYYGQQSTAGDIGRSVLAAPMKALIGILGLPGTLGALEAHARATHAQMTKGELGGKIGRASCRER